MAADTAMIALPFPVHHLTLHIRFTPMNKEKAPEFSSQMDRKTGFPVHPAQQEHHAPDNPGNSIKIISSFPGCTGMTIYVHKSNLHLLPKSCNRLAFASQYRRIRCVGVRLFMRRRSTTTPALKMACRLASAPVLTVSMLKQLQDLGIILLSTRLSPATKTIRSQWSEKTLEFNKTDHPKKLLISNYHLFFTSGSPLASCAAALVILNLSSCASRITAATRITAKNNEAPTVPRFRPP